MDSTMAHFVLVLLVLAVLIPHARSINRRQPWGVVGILTTPGHRHLRDAQRRTFLSDRHGNNIIHRFLLDSPTPDTVAEHAQHNDIYFLHSAYQGKAVRFGEKLYLWLKHAHDAFPGASFYGRIDDDVYVCGGAAFDFVRRVTTPLMYLGWMNRGGQHACMFQLPCLGRAVVAPPPFPAHYTHTFFLLTPSHAIIRHSPTLGWRPERQVCKAPFVVA